MKKRKILILSSRFIYPVVSGDKIRLYNICQELAKEYDLTLLCFCETRDEMSYNIPEDGVFSEIRRLFLPKWCSYIKTVLSCLTFIPMQVSYYKSRKMLKTVQDFSCRHDMVLCHLIRMAQYSHDINIPKIIEMTDAISLNYLRIKENPDVIKGWMGVIYRLEQKKVDKYEKDMAGKFNICSFVSSVDRDFVYSKLYKHKNSIVCGNGIDISCRPYLFNKNKEYTKRIIFIGAMRSQQNLDAVFWFSKNIMPFLREIDRYRFDILGEIDKYNAAKLKMFPNVKVFGYVKDIAKAVDGALIGVCPIRAGAGVQNKILEYMALGLPCISSSIGAEGLEVISEKHILIANNEKEYIELIVKLTVDREFASELAKNARKLIETNYSWKEQLFPLICGIKDIFNKKY